MPTADEQAILTIGNVADGFDFIGPFSSASEAIVYAEEYHDGDEYHVINLTAPVLSSMGLKRA